MNLNLLKNGLWKFPVCILIIAAIAFFIADKAFFYSTNNFRYFKNTFWAIAFGWSTFLALYAFQLHNKQYADNPEDIKEGYGKLRWSQRIHQFILHFLSGMIGWIFFYLFIYTNNLSFFTGWENLILFIIAFLAIMGYLPYTLIVKNWLPGK